MEVQEHATRQLSFKLFLMNIYMLYTISNMSKFCAKVFIYINLVKILNDILDIHSFALLQFLEICGQNLFMYSPYITYKFKCSKKSSFIAIISVLIPVILTYHLRCILIQYISFNVQIFIVAPLQTSHKSFRTEFLKLLAGRGGRTIVFSWQVFSANRYFKICWGKVMRRGEGVIS